MNAATASPPSNASHRVWDLPVRVTHWLLVICFFGAWLTREGDATRMWHMLFGYSLAFLVAFRIVWGFVGTRYARFGDFIKGPGAVAGYAGGLVRRRLVHYVGHNPLGALAIVAILALGAGMGVTGWQMAANGAESAEELHETFANAFMAVVVIHILGVIVSSVLHRENLPRAMVTGNKPHPGASVPARAGVALLLLAVLAGFWAVSLNRGTLPLGLSAGAEANEAAEGDEHRGDARGGGEREEAEED